jgi:homoserine dehydrogenase
VTSKTASAPLLAVSAPHDPSPQSASASSDAFRSSGQSPGPAPVVRTLHLVGPGQVGRSFLRQLAGVPVRVVAVSDRSATVFDRGGLALDALLAHKAAGKALATLPRAESIPTELAIRVVGADVVVDSTPSSAADTEAAVARARAALQNGAFVALAGKNALAAAAPEWLLGAFKGRVGVHAVLGGAGQQLVRELAELREHCRGVELVGNVTTTVLIEAIERGASLEQGIAEAQARGLLEPDPALDLDGSDAATKLRAVWGAVFGESWAEPVAAGAVPRDDVRALDVGVVRARAARGATTRLIARGDRGGNLRVRFEELPAGSPLAAPPDRVVYGYELPGGLRVHTGLAVGYERTAAALLADVRAAIGLEVRS